MGCAAELVMDVDDDAWNVAGEAFGQIFTQVCDRVNTGQRLASMKTPSPPTLPSKSPSPNLMAAEFGVKNVINSVLEGVEDTFNSEDMRSTIGGDSILAEESRSTVPDDFAAELADTAETAKSKVVEKGPVPDEVDKLRDNARTQLEEAVLAGFLTEVVSEVAGDCKETAGPNVEALRKEVGGMLMSAGADGRLAAALSVGDSAEELRELARQAVEEGFSSGNLEVLLKEAAGAAWNGGLSDDTILANAAAHIARNNSEEARSLTRNAILEGLQDGRLDALLAESSEQTTTQSTALVPKPPPSAPVAGLHSPVRARRLLGGSGAERVMEMISDADRKVGYLNVQITQKQNEIKDRDQTCERLTENIRFVRSDLEHLAIDLEWHREQNTLAEGRNGRLNEDRRALAMKLDGMRLERLKDDWPVDAKQSYTARSWTSTVTGGAATAMESSSSGWNTSRSIGSTQAIQG